MYAGGEHVRALSLLPFLVLCALLLVSPAVGTQGLDDDALGLPRGKEDILRCLHIIIEKVPSTRLKSTMYFRNS